jgi:hypothetical protein
VKKVPPVPKEGAYESHESVALDVIPDVIEMFTVFVHDELNGAVPEVEFE